LRDSRNAPLALHVTMTRLIPHRPLQDDPIPWHRPTGALV
jgi:hypothetical protein